MARTRVPHVPVIETPVLLGRLVLSAISVIVGSHRDRHRDLVVPARHPGPGPRPGAANGSGRSPRCSATPTTSTRRVARFVAGPGRRIVEWISAIFDVRIIDGAVNGVASLVRGAAGGLRKVQTGLVRCVRALDRRRCGRAPAVPGRLGRAVAVTDFPILSAIIATPALGALVVLFVPGRRPEVVRGRRLRRDGGDAGPRGLAPLELQDRARRLPVRRERALDQVARRASTSSASTASACS